MIPTIITMPPPIESAIGKVLARQDGESWMERAQLLHQRYFQQQEDTRQIHIQNFVDAQAYLGLRASATYAQISGALAACCEMLPNWQPQTLLDLGSGPGTVVWAASTFLPSLRAATCIDQSSHLLDLGKRILNDAQLQIKVTWQQQDVLHALQKDPVNHPTSDPQKSDSPTSYDIVVIANMLNELNGEQRQKLLHAAFSRCNHLLLLLEPGTPVGNRIIQGAVEQLTDSGTFIAPYLGKQNAASKDFWLHFPQRFTRPIFARRLRQEMRDSPLMASDWEEAKFCYAAASKIPAQITPWGRCVGPVEVGNGYLEVPILTVDDLQQVKVMKRHKAQFATAKKLRWGELLQNQEEIIHVG